MAQHEAQSIFRHRESKPIEMPPAALEARAYLQRLREEITRIQCLKLKVNIDY